MKKTVTLITCFIFLLAACSQTSVEYAVQSQHCDACLDAESVPFAAVGRGNTTPMQSNIAQISSIGSSI